jgi:prepilin-type N-terminal cleavage/methylation domain-containing protein
MRQRHTTSRRGFTLLEILVAMSLFTLIGFSVVLLMTSGVDMWLQGTRGAQNEDRKEMSLPRLEDDLRHLRVGTSRDRIPVDLSEEGPQQELPAITPANRFVSGYVTYRFGEKEVPCRYLAFVRDLSGLGEIEVYALRAGRNPAADAYIDGKDDEKEFNENRHLPTGGQIEVLWIWLPDPDDPGLGAVYRAYRTPIGGTQTLLNPLNFLDYGKLMREIKPKSVFQDVLLFDVYFWTQFTTTWEFSAGEPRIVRRPQSKAGMLKGPPACGPSRIWDSTRGMLIGGPNDFKLNRTAKSKNYAGDDIWPRAVRVEFALREMTTQLSEDFTANASSFAVFDPSFATGRGVLSNIPMKVGSEWVQIFSRDAFDSDRFDVSGRGRRGTAVINHPVETNVYFGQLFDMTIPVPAFRDDNN